MWCEWKSSKRKRYNEAERNETMREMKYWKEQECHLSWTKKKEEKNNCTRKIIGFACECSFRVSTNNLRMKAERQREGEKERKFTLFRVSRSSPCHSIWTQKKTQQNERKNWNTRQTQLSKVMKIFACLLRRVERAIFSLPEEPEVFFCRIKRKSICFCLSLSHWKPIQLLNFSI